MRRNRKINVIEKSYSSNLNLSCLSYEPTNLLDLTDPRRQHLPTNTQWKKMTVMRTIMSPRSSILKRYISMLQALQAMKLIQPMRTAKLEAAAGNQINDMS